MSTESGLWFAGRDDDGLHPVAEDDFEMVETMYLGFSIPEQRINVEIFHWFHPVLGTAAGGVLIFRGDRRDPLHADGIDFRSHMPIPLVANGSMEFATGVRVTVVEPLERIDVSYKSADGTVEFDVRMTAIMPAVAPADGHLCQALRTNGRLSLHGEDFAVDGWFTRDRSWGKPRTEAALPVPAITWMAAAFNDDLAFHVVGFDSAEVPNPLQWGYVWSEGTVKAVTSLDLKTSYAEDGCPVSASLSFHDESGRLHELSGVRKASLPFSIWPNMVTEFTQMSWTYGGWTGSGDLQSVQYPGFRRRFAR